MRTLLSRKAQEQLVEAAEPGDVTLQLEQGGEIRAHFVPVDQPTQLHDDALDVEPVLGSIGEDLECNECTRCSELQSYAGDDFLGARGSDRLVLEWKRTQRHDFTELGLTVPGELLLRADEVIQ